MILFSFNLSAQDLIITSRDIIYIDGECNTNGSITFNAIEAPIDNFPIEIEVTSGPSIGGCIR